MHDPWRNDPEPGWFVAHSGGLFVFAGASGGYFHKYWWPLSPWASLNLSSLSDCFAHPLPTVAWLLGLLACIGFSTYIFGCVAGLVSLWCDGLHQPRIPIVGSLVLAGAAALVLAMGPVVPAQWGVLWMSAARGFYIALLAGGMGNVLLGLLARLLMPAHTAPATGHFIHHAASASHAMPPAPAPARASLPPQLPAPPPLRLPGNR